MLIRDITKINSVNVIKVADAVAYDSDSKPHVRVELNYTENATTKGKMQLIYLIVADGEVIKAGLATNGKTGVKGCLNWYGTTFTKSMKEGRVAPHYFMRKCLDEGKLVEIYAELIEMETYERPSISGLETITGKRPVMDPKDREKDWSDFIGVTPLNRQEKGSKSNDPILAEAMIDYGRRGGNVDSKWKIED